MIRRWLLFKYIDLLEWYLDLPSIHDQTNQAQDFLAESWRHKGYREFAAKRNQTLINEAAGGAGLAPHDRLKYAELIGRRIENLNTIALSKKAFQLEEQKKLSKK